MLIALQINNWNEVLKSKLKSQVYVTKIINDLINIKHLSVQVHNMF
ncbi:hypothetical protein [Paucihalobacter sp.]